ncbi:HD domain-containing protein [Candidatus Bathyarchaeota archaeon]|nr:MAG: HD domain-containing protein [Candidatus Bathyarchaeota archaeon]
MSHLEEKALEFASIKHEGQMDDQGRPYFFAHIIQVYSLLKDVTDDVEILCAGILHDTIEDTGTTYDELVREFNKEIADLVTELTFQGDEDVGRYFPLLRSHKAIVVKYADRLSNLVRMVDWPGDWQEGYLKNSVFWPTEPKNQP